MESPKWCIVGACRTPVPKAKIFCRKHWDMVPWALKEWLLELYVIGQGSLMRSGIPWHPDWDHAIMVAKKAVEESVRDAMPRLHG